MDSESSHSTLDQLPILIVTVKQALVLFYPGYLMLGFSINRFKVES